MGKQHTHLARMYAMVSHTVWRNATSGISSGGLIICQVNVRMGCADILLSFGSSMRLLCILGSSSKLGKVRFVG